MWGPTLATVLPRTAIGRVPLAGSVFWPLRDQAHPDPPPRMLRPPTVRFLAMILTTAFLESACSKGPTVDATSSITCESSLQAVSKAARASKDSAAYVSAMMRIAGPLAMRSTGTAFGTFFGALGGGPRATVEPPTADSTVIRSAICDALQGLTAHDIATRADSLSPSIGKAFDQRMARAYLAKLQGAKRDFALVQDSLGKFRVLSASLRQGDGFMGLESTILLTVANETSHSISRAYFSAVAQSQGREIPWISDTFNYTIPGGLAPGEHGSWHLKPNMFSGSWSKVRVPADAHFTVTVMKLDGPNSEPLWGGVEFSAVDQKHLDSLTTVMAGK